MSRIGMKGAPLPGGPAGAFIAAGAVLGVVYVFFKVNLYMLYIFGFRRNFSENVSLES